MESILSSPALNRAVMEAFTTAATTVRWMDSLPPAISTFACFLVAFCLYMCTDASRRGMIRG